MKNEAILKINKFGKIGSIIALVAKILVGIGIFFLLISSIACLVMPKDLVDVRVSKNVGVTVNMDNLGLDFTDEEWEAAQAEFEMEATLAGEELDMEDITFEDKQIVISETTDEKNLTIRNFGWLLLLLTAGLAMVMVLLFFVSALCKAFRDCESPFEEKVIKKMQNLSYSLIPWALISTVTQSVADSLANNNFSITVGVDLGVILIILIVFALTYIFKYGAVLQQESDETL